MAAEAKDEQPSYLSVLQQERINHLQLDLNDLDEKLAKLKKRLKAKVSDEERGENDRILAETEARISSKKLEMAEIHAVMNKADGDEDSKATTDAGSAGPYTLHHSQFWLPCFVGMDSVPLNYS